MEGCMNVCLGGTFYPLHKGHKALLRKAFQIAGPTGTVFIGVTSNEMIQQKGRLASYEQRKRAIQKFLEKENVRKQSTIQQLTDKFGPTMGGNFDAIVVSPETKSTAEEINEKRLQRGKKPLQIIVIPFVLSEDGKPISSTRIRKNEIDENGLLRKED